MKTLTILIAFALASIASAEDTVLVAKSPGDPRLKHVLRFEPSSKNSKAKLLASVRNVSSEELNIRFRFRGFYSKLRIQDADRRSSLAYEKDNRQRRLSVLPVGVKASLLPGEERVWTAPLEALVTQKGRSIAEEALAGATVISEIELSIVPDELGVPFKNVRLESEPMTIPKSGMPDSTDHLTTDPETNENARPVSGERSPE